MAGRMPVPPLRRSCRQFWLAPSLTAFSRRESAGGIDVRRRAADVFRCATDHFCRVLPVTAGLLANRMPTIALTNSIAFANVPDVERDFRASCDGHYRLDCLRSGMWFLPQILGYADISPTNIPLLITAGSSALLGVLRFPARHATKKHRQNGY
ncbi:hypothetical protein ACVXHA_00150 [Escherichia coli]